MSLTELQEVQTRILGTPIYDFERLASLLQLRGHLIADLQPSIEACGVLEEIAEESRRLSIRIQAERRRLLLESSELRHRKRILEAWSPLPG
jgi:hypothetical protein